MSMVQREHQPPYTIECYLSNCCTLSDPGDPNIQGFSSPQFVIIFLSSSIIPSSSVSESFSVSPGTVSYKINLLKLYWLTNKLIKIILYQVKKNRNSRLFSQFHSKLSSLTLLENWSVFLKNYVTDFG